VALAVMATAASAWRRNLYLIERRPDGSAGAAVTFLMGESGVCHHVDSPFGPECYFMQHEDGYKQVLRAFRSACSNVFACVVADCGVTPQDRCLGLMLAIREIGFEVGPNPSPESRRLPDARFL
jgi:hypothetical protein